jgi:hypothetical protein
MGKRKAPKLSKRSDSVIASRATPPIPTYAHDATKGVSDCCQLNAIFYLMRNGVKDGMILAASFRSAAAFAQNEERSRHNYLVEAS